MSDVRFRRVDCYEELKEPGDGYWTGSEAPDVSPGRLMFKCPCGCGSVAGIRVAGEHRWEWNGDLEKPTTSPSIRISGGNRPEGGDCWHGYLTDGVFKSC